MFKNPMYFAWENINEIIFVTSSKCMDHVHCTSNRDVVFYYTLFFTRYNLNSYVAKRLNYSTKYIFVIIKFQRDRVWIIFEQI